MSSMSCWTRSHFDSPVLVATRPSILVANLAMIHGRLSHVAAPTPGGGALVAGGEDQATAELYAPGDDGAEGERGEDDHR